LRPNGRGALESLYFTYPDFTSKRAPELDVAGLRHPVAIVGAGPVGMTAALALARYGVRSVLLDRKNTFNDGSRAICIARASFHILEQIGTVGPFLAKSLGWRRGRSYYRGDEIYRFEMPHSDNDKYLPMYNLQQQYIEQFLWDAVEKCELIDARWRAEVTGVRNDNAGATLDVTSPEGTYPLHCGYILAADGARSPLRNMLGLRLHGDNYEGRYVIADVRMAHDFPTERRAFFEPAANPGGTVLIHRQPDDIWRIDYQLRAGESEEDALKESSIRARVGAILEEIGHKGDWDLEWWSVYSANTLCLDDYRRGRVFFVGDSAHIVPIFGVRGLNNGMADAYNIGWKLGYVLAGNADPKLLDSYSPERRGATLDVFANATKSTRFMTPPTRGWALVREAALSLAGKHEFARKFADPRQMQPYTYGGSPITCFARNDAAFARGPVSGALAANARLSDGSYLLDHAGAGFSGVFFVDETLRAESDALFARLRALDLRFTSVALDASSEVAPVYDAQPGTFYLLRPDLHVAGRWRRFDPDEIAGALRTCLGKDAA